MEGYTFIGQVIKDPNAQKFATGVILGGVLLGAAAYVRSRLRTKEDREAQLVPRRFSLLSFFDFFVEAFINFHDSVVGPEYRRYASFSGSIFLFLLAANFLGLVPGMVAATTTVWVNVGLAILVFIYFNYLGVKHNGVVGYLKHFAGPLLPLAVFIFPLEIFSTTLRIFTLNLRLYWNISADHIVMATFTGLAPLAGVPAYALGVFVATIQALVFTTLTMVYIQIAVQHEEEH